jgi:hypothetical protein
MEGIGKLCTWHRAEVTAVNMSNAYEYMRTARPAFAELARLPLSQEAKLFMVSGHIRAALQQGRYDSAESALAQELGSAMEGAVLPAKEWLGPSGRGQGIDALIWKAPSCAEMIAWNALGPKIQLLGEAWFNAAGLRIPMSPEELANVEAVVDAALASSINA